MQVYTNLTCLQFGQEPGKQCWCGTIPHTPAVLPLAEDYASAATSQTTPLEHIQPVLPEEAHVYQHTCMCQALFGQLPSLNKVSNFPTIPALIWSKLGISVTFSALSVLRSLFCVCPTPYDCSMASSLLPLFAHHCHLKPSHRPTPSAILLDCSSRFSFVCFSTCHIHPADCNIQAATYFSTFCVLIHLKGKIQHFH